MVKTWPALDTSTGDADLLLAALDDFAPTAVDARGMSVRVFFASSDARDRALEELAGRGTVATAVDVPDGDWARRSQESLTPIGVGRLAVTPPWHQEDAAAAFPLVVVILPSMGFGTGHHATTRLCLAALQAVDVNGKDVLDVGTGSGVLAMAARLLGARSARGIDNDADAVQSARDNLALNPGASDVAIDLVDLNAGIGTALADIVTANLTGALLERAAASLLGAVRPGGTIIVSGLMSDERTRVEAAFAGARLLSAWDEAEWVALAFER